MAGTPDKKQQLTAALAGVRIQLLNELLLLRRSLNFGQHILESLRNQPVGMDRKCRHFRVASVSHTSAQKEDLHSQPKSGQKPSQAARQTLERGLEHLQDGRSAWVKCRT
jgi:hypothetical protein